MARFLAARVIQSAAIVFLVASLTFVLLKLAPGDPIRAGQEAAIVPREVRDQLRRNFGLDRPIHVQYVRYVANLARGDFGYSFAEHRPAARAIGDRIPNTLALGAAALAVTFLCGIAIGALQGMRSASRTDYALSVATLTLYSVPVFWLGVMLLAIFGEALQWLPVGGAVDPVAYPHLSLAGRLWDRATHLVLPALTLGLVGAAGTARYQRAALLEVIGQDFVRTARAKGLAERVVLLRHALRNALLPTITLFGLSVPIILSGTVLVETVFAWPGLGKLAVDSIGRRDYAVVTGAAIIASAMVVLGNLLADLLYRLADPRTRGEA
ncbi:MAG: ABC transporter permease [Gemmatimonadales bacterium]